MHLPSPVIFSLLIPAAKLVVFITPVVVIFTEDAGIKVSAIVPSKHRLSAPEPQSRSDFLKCKPDFWCSFHKNIRWPLLSPTQGLFPIMANHMPSGSLQHEENHTFLLIPSNGYSEENHLGSCGYVAILTSSFLIALFCSSHFFVVIATLFVIFLFYLIQLPISYTTKKKLNSDSLSL